jgi:hypothetical protein
MIEGASGAAYMFEGPFEGLGDLDEQAGVYAVLCVRANRLDLVDVGESSRVRACVGNNDRVGCWKQNCFGILKYAVYYEDINKDHSRFYVQSDIVANHYLICGG